MSNTKNQLLRTLPSIGKLLDTAAAERLVDSYGSSLTTTHLREVVDLTRRHILDGRLTATPTADDLLAQTAASLDRFTAPTLHSVINATGVIIHTNLGRATLSESAQEAVTVAAQSYSSLEFDIPSGKRGSRSVHAELLLQQVTGAEAALVVNNTAAGVMMMLAALCRGKEVIISRGQLIEIGGGFRVPDVMAQSGAILVEVGTTNRTHLRDYANAITENTAAILVAHHSNFRIIGFTTEPDLADIAALAHEHGLPLLYDQGSGCLLDTEPFGLMAEPTVLDGIEADCDVIAFSGDKLLGGPQAGVLCGRTEYIQKLKRHPLARAMRPDKLCLAGLAATLTHYLKNEHLTQIPVWRMISRPLDEIARTAQQWRERWLPEDVDAEIQESFSTVGGGSLPGTTIPTVAIAIQHPHLEAFAAHLRTTAPHVIGRIQDNSLLLDPRTVLPDQAEPLIHAVTVAYHNAHE